MTREEEKPEPSFKVADRRRFSETGEARSGVDVVEEAAVAAPPAEPPHDDASASLSHAAGADREIDFAAFVLSLTTQALAHLGEIPDPVERATRVDLHSARQIIDIIAMLRDKTRGNLDDAESTLLENALYDLRMRYVELAQRR
jgi:hypothetical protein